MNVSELARTLRISQDHLLDLLPKMGYDVGRRAIKIDNILAQRIMREWKMKLMELDRARVRDERERVTQQTAGATEKKIITLPSVITVRDFAGILGLPVTAVMRELINQGILATVNERIDFDTASIIAQDLGFQTAPQASVAQGETPENIPTVAAQSIDGQGAQPRPPVVVVMGHIDHGKTKLLDAIRRTRVVETEAGGITQHIGAYQISVQPKGEISRDARDDLARRQITFIDTPGHEAFMTMRARGAKVADIAILVVAADDGVQPQTKEAINIIKGAGLPMVVAINKIDKPEANIEKTKKELAASDVLAEEYGGKVPMVPLSAKQGQGIEELLEMILLVADMEKENIRANPDRPAQGTVIESRLDKLSGPFATVLVQQGTLRLNDPLVIAGTLYGKVRSMRNDLGEIIEGALPGTPVAILGFKVVPAVGDVVEVAEATTVVRRVERREDRAVKLLQSFVAQDTAGAEARRTLLLIIKADVLGSLEAILGELEKIEHQEVGVKVIARGLGTVTDADIERAASEHAQVLAFRVKPTMNAQQRIKDKGIALHSFEVIYHLLDHVKNELTALLAPEIRKKTLGVATVVVVFKKTGRTTIVGGRIGEGAITTKALVEAERSGVPIGRGTIVELQLDKHPVDKVVAGQECGMRFEGKVELAQGDVLRAIEEETVERTLESP